MQRSQSGGARGEQADGGSGSCRSPIDVDADPSELLQVRARVERTFAPESLESVFVPDERSTHRGRFVVELKEMPVRTHDCGLAILKMQVARAERVGFPEEVEEGSGRADRPARRGSCLRRRRWRPGRRRGSAAARKKRHGRRDGGSGRLRCLGSGLGSETEKY